MQTKDKRAPNAATIDCKKGSGQRSHYEVLCARTIRTLSATSHSFVRVSARRHHSRSKKKAVAQTQQQPDPAPVPPPPPPTPEQLPAIPPKLTYQNGLLTIVAQNCTLGDILRDVHSKTGAAIDVPGPATERVVGQFGPGSPRDVLATLLNGSHFNYVMVGTPTSPDSVAQVILTPKTGG